MVNKKAFTMVELIVIMIIIGVILIFALPNVTSTLERNKKDVMINDAKDFVEKTKNCINFNKASCPNSTGTYSLETVDSRKEIKESPFGNEYNRASSVVQVSKVGNTYEYKITLYDDEYKINSKTIDQLNSDNKYKFVERVG